MTMIRPIRLLFAVACALALAGCANTSMYVGTTFGAPWGGVSIGTTVPIGYGRPCCWEDDAEENEAEPADAEDDAAETADPDSRPDRIP